MAAGERTLAVDDLAADSSLGGRRRRSLGVAGLEERSTAVGQRFDKNKELEVSRCLDTQRELHVDTFAVDQSGEAVIVTVGGEVSAQISGHG